MVEIIKAKHVRERLPRRQKLSHKGDNGRVLIIGGSLEYFGAPILSALGALNSGADLVTLLVPECNFEVTRSFYPDFIVQHYNGSHLNLRAIDIARDLMKKNDVLLIGPGLGSDPEATRIAAKILKDAEIPVVADAEALGVVHERRFQKSPMIITPNAAEFNELIAEDYPHASAEEREALLKKYAETWNVTILFKGATDYIITPHGDIFINQTGDPGMTVGGSGDVLAGLTASLVSQHLLLDHAAACASFILGLCGEHLAEQKAHNYSATDLAMELPFTLKRIL